MIAAAGRHRSGRGKRVRALDPRLVKWVRWCTLNVALSQLNTHSMRQRTLLDIGENLAGLGTDLGTDSVFESWGVDSEFITNLRFFCRQRSRRRRERLSAPGIAAQISHVVDMSLLRRVADADSP
jgi:hypothetical protein